MTDLNIPATPGRGTGVLLPLSKSLADLTYLQHALTRDWPVTRQDVQSALGAAYEHLGTDMAPLTRLMSDEAVTSVNGFIGNTTARLTELRRAGLAPDEPIRETDKTTLKQIIEEHWALFTLLDRELLGLTILHSNPGTTP